MSSLPSTSSQAFSLRGLINPTPRQLEFLQAADAHKFTLYGGAAGGGKSYILRWWLVRFLLHAFGLHGVGNLNVGLFCEDYPTLKDRQLARMAVEFPKWLGIFKETREEGLVFKLHEKFGGGKILPRNLDEPSKYNSVEFAAIAVDELTRNPPEVFDELRKRLRWPGLPEGFIFPFAGGTNPGGIGHAWVKKLWKDRDFPPELESVADQFAFVQAKAQDNPHNPKSYYQDLLTLPPEMRKAYAEGDWDLFAGQYFTEFRRDLHVIQPFKIPAYWERFSSFDWGFAAPACFGWHAVSPDGLVITYREHYVKRTSTRELARQAVALTGNEKLRYKVGDPSCWDSSRGVSIAEEMAAEGWLMVKADNERVNGWSRVRDFLAWERNPQGEYTRLPLWQCFSTCTNLIRTLPSLPHDPHNPEDVDSDAEDHAPDMLRYGLMTRPRPTIVPLDVLPTEYAEAQMRMEHDAR